MISYIFAQLTSPKNLLEMFIYMTIVVAVGVHIPYTGLLFLACFLPVIFTALFLARHIVEGITWKAEIPELTEEHPDDFVDVDNAN